MADIMERRKHLKIKLKALRVNAELTQEEAASELGITKRTLQKWEDYQTSPTGAQLTRMANLYGCTLDDIFLPDPLARS